MRKIGMFVAAAAVVSYAGAAQAQVTAVINATANINSVLTITATDATADCGTITGGAVPSTRCIEADPTLFAGSVTVTSNSNWTLSIADAPAAGSSNLCDAVAGFSAPAGANAVTLCNNIATHPGLFVVDLEYTASTCGTIAGSGETFSATAASACLVTINQEATGSSISLLDSADGYGPYTGAYVVTATGT